MLLYRACAFAADGTVSSECTRSGSGGVTHIGDVAESQRSLWTALSIAYSP